MNEYHKHNEQAYIIRWQKHIAKLLEMKLKHENMFNMKLILEVILNTINAIKLKRKL